MVHEQRRRELGPFSERTAVQTDDLKLVLVCPPLELRGCLFNQRGYFRIIHSDILENGSGSCLRDMKPAPLLGAVKADGCHLALFPVSEVGRKAR